MYRKCRLETFLVWLVWTILIAWPLYWVVVIQAATDNLTELIMDGGALSSSSVLAFGFFLFFLASAAISNYFVTRLNDFRVVLIVGAVFLSVLCFWFGSEQVIMKYGKVFSAWQFILSTNRENYVDGVHLFFHFALVYGVLLGFCSMLQAPLWRMLETSKGVQNRSLNWLI